MWQQVIAYLIGILALVYVAAGIYRLFTRGNDPCSGCAGCGIHNELKKARTKKSRK